MNNTVRNTSFTNSNEGAVSYDLMPPYSMQGIEFIYSNVFQNKHQIIADIGSGTGRLTAQLIQNNEIYAVEPDTKMSAVAESKFKDFSNFHSINGFAEFTTLNSNSIDFIVVGQALHRFDIAKFKKEAIRILKNPNNIIILYNRIDYSIDIIQDLLMALKSSYSAYKSRFEFEDESIGSLIETQKNCQSIDLIYPRHHVYAYFRNEFIVNETKFFNLCLSLWIFPLSNGEDAQRIIHSKDFDLPKFKCIIKMIFDKYSTNNLIVLPLSTEVHFPY